METHFEIKRPKLVEYVLPQPQTPQIDPVQLQAAVAAAVSVAVKTAKGGTVTKEQLAAISRATVASVLRATGIVTETTKGRE